MSREYNQPLMKTEDPDWNNIFYDVKSGAEARETAFQGVTQYPPYEGDYRKCFRLTLIKSLSVSKQIADATELRGEQVLTRESGEQNK